MKIKNEVNKQFNLFCWNTFFSTLFCFHFFCHSIIAIYFWFLFFELFSFYSFFSIFFSISSWILSFEISSYVFLCFLFRLSFNAYNFCTLTPHISNGVQLSPIFLFIRLVAWHMKTICYEQFTHTYTHTNTSNSCHSISCTCLPFSANFKIQEYYQSVQLTHHPITICWTRI